MFIGKYRYHFSYPGIVSPPKTINVPYTVTVLGYTGAILSYENDTANKKLVIEFELRPTEELITVQSALNGGKNKVTVLPAIPVAAVVIAIAAVIGITVIFLTLDKVEKLVEGPGGVSIQVIGLLAAAAALFFVLPKLKKTAA